MPRITIESAKAEIARQQDFIDILENHCTIRPEDSMEEIIFKLYATLQSIVSVHKELKKYVPNHSFKESSDLTKAIPKMSISDKKLETFVKKLQSDGKRFSRGKD